MWAMRPEAVPTPRRVAAVVEAMWATGRVVATAPAQRVGGAASGATGREVATALARAVAVEAIGATGREVATDPALRLAATKS
jgi:hypothetical protein